MLSIADWMILVAACLPHVIISIAKRGAKGFDNLNPRDREVYEREPWRLRAYNAHLNAFEAFPFFAAAIILAEFRLAPQLWVNVLAIVFIAARVLHAYFYIKVNSNVRSIMFMLGFLINIAIFLSPLL